MSDLFCAARLLLAAPAPGLADRVRAERPAQVWSLEPEQGDAVATGLGVRAARLPEAGLSEIADQCRGETAVVVGTSEQLADPIGALVPPGPAYDEVVRRLDAGDLVVVLVDADGVSVQ